jgi:hypothetical protein
MINELLQETVVGQVKDGADFMPEGLWMQIQLKNHEVVDTLVFKIMAFGAETAFAHKPTHNPTCKAKSFSWSDCHPHNAGEWNPLNLSVLPDHNHLAILNSHASNASHRTIDERSVAGLNH